MVGSVAFVGVAGGAGTTRTVVELGGVLARAGRSVLVFDLDFATQGLARFVDGRIEPDATALLADPECALSEAVHEVTVDGDGRLGLVPAFAPFAQIAEAKTPSAGAQVGERLEAADADYDHVLLDVPPVVSNQAVGAVTAAESVVAVVPPTDRGVDALQRERGRLADVGAGVDEVLAVGGTSDAVPPDADHHVPALPGDAPASEPTVFDSTGPYSTAVAAVAHALCAIDLEADIETRSGLVERLSDRLGN